MLSVSVATFFSTDNLGAFATSYESVVTPYRAFMTGEGVPRADVINGSGTGQGSLAFAGSYTGNGHKLTINNFDFGSTLSFQSNLTSSISNTSLFEYVNGGFSSTSWNGTTFTITAISEPSTYLAAGGLIAFMLWSGRRRLACFAARRREDV